MSKIKKPFHRALALASAIAKFGSITAIAELGEYMSRGKGRGGHSGKKWGPRPSYRYMVRIERNGNIVWVQRENGERECARRVRQQQRKLAAA